MVKKKGQVFLVIGIVILLSFILLKVATIPLPREELLLKESFLDLKVEYAKTIDLTLVRQPPNPAQTLQLNLDRFAIFSSDAFKQKNHTQKLLYSFTYDGSEVAVGNFLGQDISDVEIRLNEENPEYIGELKNGQSALRNLTGAESFVVNISYKIDNEQKSFTYSGTNEDTVVSYFDIWLGYGKSFFKDIFVEKRKITTLIQTYEGYGEINYTKITEITEPFVIIISHLAGDTLTGFVTVSGSASYGSTIETITDSTFSGKITGLKQGSLMLNSSLTGEFISDPIATEKYIMWATLDWVAELKDQTLEFWIRSDSNSAWSKVNKGEKVYFGSGKELQYMVNFTTTDISVSPVLHQVTLRYATPNSEKEPVVKVRVDGIEGIATKSSFDPKTGILNWNFYFNTNRLLNGAYQISAALYEEGVAIAVEDYYININIWNELWPAGKALPTCPFGCRIIDSGTTDDLYGIGMGSVLIGGARGTILSYDDKKIKILENRTTQTIRKVAFKPQGDYALFASSGEAEKETEICEYNTTIDNTSLASSIAASVGEAESKVELYGAAWHPDGAYALLVGKNGIMLKYDGETYTEIETGITDDLYNIAWHPLSSYALAVGENGTAIRYNIDGTIEPLYFGTTADLRGVAWHPSGKYLLVVGSGLVIKYDGSDITTYSPMATCYRWYTTCPPCRGFDPKPCFGRPYCFRLPVIVDPKKVIIREQPLIKTKLIKSSLGTFKEIIKEESLIEIEESIRRLCLPCFVPYPCPLDAYGISWHPSSEYAIITGANGKVFMFNHSTDEFKEIPSGTSANLFDVKWKNDGCYALAVGSGGTVLRYSCLLGISNENVTNIKDDYAEISFETNDPATSQVTIWTTDPLVNTTFDSPILAYEHTIALTGLTPSTTYSYEIYANNTCNDEATSTGTFTTKSNKYCESDGECIKDDACCGIATAGVGCVNYKYPPSPPSCNVDTCPPCPYMSGRCCSVLLGKIRCIDCFKCRSCTVRSCDCGICVALSDICDGPCKCICVNNECRKNTI